MNYVLLKLKNARDHMSNTERNIADFILNNAETACRISIRDMSAKTFSSPASIVRLCRSIGFSGYREFQSVLSLQLAVIQPDFSQEHVPIHSSDTISSIIRKTTTNSKNALEETLQLLDPNIIKSCVDLIDSSKNVLLFGMGASLLSAKDAYMKFLRLNKPAVVNDDWHCQLLSAKNSTADDVALIFSYSGQTTEMVRCMEFLKKNNTPCISITRFSNTPVVKMSTYCLYISGSEAIFRSGAMSSRIAQMNVIDILYTSFLVRHGDKNTKQLIHTHILKEYQNLAEEKTALPGEVPDDISIQ